MFAPDSCSTCSPSSGFLHWAQWEGSGPTQVRQEEWQAAKNKMQKSVQGSYIRCNQGEYLIKSKPLRRVHQIHPIRKLLSSVLYIAQGDNTCERPNEGDVNWSHLSGFVRSVKLEHEKTPANWTILTWFSRYTFTEWCLNTMASVFIEDFKNHPYKGHYYIFCKDGHRIIVYYVIYHPLYRHPGNKILLEFMWGKAAFLDKEDPPSKEQQEFDNPSQFLVFLGYWLKSDPDRLLELSHAHVWYN